MYLDYRSQMEVTREALKELGIVDISQVIVYNKATSRMENLPRRSEDSIYMAAGEGIGILL